MERFKITSTEIPFEKFEMNLYEQPISSDVLVEVIFEDNVRAIGTADSFGWSCMLVKNPLTGKMKYADYHVGYWRKLSNAETASYELINL